jgi:TPP-dependent pyruvate/acetoin dehydrogenase alpha subunit
MSDVKVKSSKSKFSKKFIEEALTDFKVACISREASLSGRKEVLRGKAKFGIFGDGKEIAQVAMARVFKNGDFRSGYYRDQTFMLASGLANVQQLYAQLYAHADAEHEPFSGGRQMNAHFATPLIDKEGEWTNHTQLKNVSSDISPTAGQMARALGLALASKKYRECQKNMGEYADKFSVNGNEVSFCTIGDASTSEGVFWETINAAGVLQVPLAVFVWDDGYGISVPRHFQTTKGSISEVLKGFNSDENGKGVDIYTVKGWDYVALRDTFDKAIEKVRKTHTPCLFHVQECTQPQGHSTSGSHERYKSQERLDWEKTQDGIEQMKSWLITQGAATEAELTKIQEDAAKEVKDAIKAAFNAFNNPIKTNQLEALVFIDALLAATNNKEKVSFLREALAKAMGTSRDELADMLVQQESLNKLKGSFNALSKETLATLKTSGKIDEATYKNLISGKAASTDYYDALKQAGMAQKEIIELLGDEAAISLESQSAQEKFNDAMDKAKEVFSSFVDGGYLDSLADTLVEVIKFLQGYTEGEEKAATTVRELKQQGNLSEEEQKKVDTLKKAATDEKGFFGTYFTYLTEGVAGLGIQMYKNMAAEEAQTQLENIKSEKIQIPAKDFVIKTLEEDTVVAAGGTNLGRTDEMVALLKELTMVMKQGGNVYLDLQKVGSTTDQGTYRLNS